MTGMPVHVGERERVSADTEVDVVAEIDVAGFAVQPIPALRDDVGREQREQEGREIGAAEHRHERGKDQNEADQGGRQPGTGNAAGGLSRGHVPLRRSIPCGNTTRMASRSMMLRPGAHSDVQKNPVSASATPRKMPGQQRARQAADAAQDDDRERLYGQREPFIGIDRIVQRVEHAGDRDDGASRRPPSRREWCPPAPRTAARPPGPASPSAPRDRTKSASGSGAAPA